MRRTIDTNLANCKICKYPGLQLFLKNIVYFSSEIKIKCDNFEKIKKMHQEIIYSLQTIKNFTKEKLGRTNNLQAKQ